MLGKAERTLEGMSATLNALLDINQLEAGVIRPKLVDVPISEILGDIQERVRGAGDTQRFALAGRLLRAHRAQRSPSARGDDSQSAVERGPLYGCGHDSAGLPAPRR